MMTKPGVLLRLYLLLFIAAWMGSTWLLLGPMEWSATITSTLAAIGVSYALAGFIAVTPPLVIALRELQPFRRQSDRGIVLRKHPVRVFIPADVLRLHRRT